MAAAEAGSSWYFVPEDPSNVTGSVLDQGRKDFPPGQDLSIVDALAGGQTRLADLKHVKLPRVDSKGCSEVREIDVDAIQKDKGSFARAIL